jgi:plasmid stabilization system protein ParE
VIYRLHADATAELDAAVEWYDAQLAGLGLELLDAIDDAFALILQYPDAWPRDGVVAERVIRRFVLRRFPFAVVYYVADGVVRVIAVAHGHRIPGYWRRRVRDP